MNEIKRKGEIIVMLVVMVWLCGCTWRPGESVVMIGERGGRAVVEGGLAVEVMCEAGPVVRVVVDALNVRSGPGVEYPVVGWLLAGDVARLAGPAAGEWWPVEVAGRVGWARSVYLEVAECAR